MSDVRIELITTDGIFSLDGADFEVTNNVWMIGNDQEVLVVDAAHEVQPIVDAIAGRLVLAIACTHGHNDHINAARGVADLVDAPIWLHPDDRMLWDVVYPDRAPDGALADGQVIKLGGAELGVLHTPGHSPGCCCFHASELAGTTSGVVFSGDTLFCGGPGATGRSFSDPQLILRSIQSRLMGMPAATIVHTGHGDSTTIGAESALIAELIAQGEATSS